MSTINYSYNGKYYNVPANIIENADDPRDVVDYIKEVYNLNQERDDDDDDNLESMDRATVEYEDCRQ